MATALNVSSTILLLTRPRTPYGSDFATQLLADATTARTKSCLLLARVSQLAPLLEQIKHYDREISRLFLQHPDSAIFASLPRDGKRIAPRLLAGWGDDRERYASAAGVQAVAGTSPVAYEGG